MAYAQRIITSNSAGDQEFTFTFPYIKEEHIKVFVNFVEKAQGTGSTEFQVITNTTPKKISLNTGLASANTRVEIKRISSLATPLVDFEDGSTLTAADLDTAEKQSLFIAQELDDALKQGISIDASTGIPTLSSQRLSNVADPVNAQDVVTKAYLERSGSITSTQIADATIVNGDIANTTITGAKLVNDTITATQIAADAITASELANNAVDTNAVADDAVTYAKIQNVSATDRILGRDSSGAGVVEEITPANVRTMLNVEDGATADQTAAEIRTLVESASDSNVFTDADHTKLNAIEASADVTDATNVDAAGAVMNSDTTTAAMQFVVDEDNFSSNLDTKVPTQQSSKAYIASVAATLQPLDSELTQLAGMQSGTASKLADNTALTSDIADLNQLDGMAKQTTITDDDAKFPTSGAVVDYVAAQIAPIGGLEVIANETVFPATQPSSGVVISIADAGGLITNGSGVASNARTSGNGSDNVTINGFPSSLFSQTLGAGLGLMVTSTGSSNTYNYHKLLAKEVDVKQLSDDINDFGERYRVVDTVGDATGNSEGDLIYAKDQNKLLVYDTSLSPAAFKETQSVGNFFVSTLTPAFNGSLIDFTLSNAPVNAQQVLLSIAGVIQKPNEGTGRPSEGFSLNGGTLQLPTGSAPASGTDYFVVVMGSTVNLATPGNNTVTSTILQNGSVITAKLADQAVTLDKLLHGDSNSNGKFLRANNGADPTFETVAAATGASNAIQTTDGSGNFTASNTFTISGDTFQGHDIVLVRDSSNAEPTITPGSLANITLRTCTNASGAFGSILNNSGLQLGRNTQYVKLAAPSDQSGQASYTFTFPPISGTNGQALTTNGSGTTSWTTINSDLVSDSSPQLGGDLDTNSHNISLDDNHKVNFGDSSDLQIYHDGSHSYLVNSTNYLYHRSTQNHFENAAGNQVQAKFIENGACELNHSGSKKFETTSAGINVDGSITCDDLVTAGAVLHEGDTNTLIHFDANDEIAFKTNGTTRMRVHNSLVRMYRDTVPDLNNTYDLGTTSLRWRNIYTNDLNLSNEGGSNDVDGTWGSYTIQEGAEDLFLVNKRNGKKYKFNLTEVS